MLTAAGKANGRNPWNTIPYPTIDTAGVEQSSNR